MCTTLSSKQLTVTNYTLQLDCRLGSGTFGSVYIARHTGSKATLAVKLISPKRNSERRFHREAFNHAACSNHKNIVDLYGAEKGRLDGVNYYVLSLQLSPYGAWYVKSHQPPAESTVSDLAHQLIQGINHIHHLGFIHCDIKLENVLVFLDPVTQGMNIKISDFGLSTAPDDRPVILADRLGSLHYAGNEFFLAPGRWQYVWTPQQDWYSTGITILSLMGCPAPCIEKYIDVPSKFISSKESMHRRHNALLRPLVASPYSAEAVAAVAGLVAEHPSQRSLARAEKWARPLGEQYL